MIEIRNISKSYGEKVALSDVNFAVKEGEIVGLLGVNGAGKSTLMKIMSGIIPPDKGDIIVSGQNILRQPLEVKKNVGYLSEDNPLYEDMYVTEYISFVAGLFKTDKKEVNKVIEQVGLVNEYRKKIKYLSKGNRQRVGIAQVLVHDPKLIILDEPTAGLDPNQRDSLNKLFVELSKDKVILFSTHILQDVRDICSRIILMNEAKIILDKEIEYIESVENMFHQLTNENSSR